MPDNALILIAVAAGMFLLIDAITFMSHNYSLNNIKSRTVGDGQHGTARWASREEIGKSYTRVSFRPEEWRTGKDRPWVQGVILGSEGKPGHITALVDKDDVHTLMIGASGIGFAIQNQMTVNDLLVAPIGTHPMLTASPAGYPLIMAAEAVAKTLRK